MTVVCINDNWVPDPDATGKPCPNIGDNDMVTDTIEKVGRAFYILERFGDKRGFLTSHFVDLPDATADEMQDETREAIANLETELV